MKIQKIAILTFATVALIQSGHGAVLLLSSNATGGDAPGAVGTLGSGASYTWQNLGTGWGPGNTDSGTIGQDLSYTKMKDGGSVANGGNFATFSVYGGNVGQTLIFNLGGTRLVDYVRLSARVATNQAGVGYFAAYTSTDGTNFTLFERWSEVAPADSPNATLTIDPAGSVLASHVMFYTNRYAGNVGATALPGQATYYQQTVLGEAMVFGTVPEPAAMSFGLVATCGLIIRRRR